MLEPQDLARFQDQSRIKANASAFAHDPVQYAQQILGIEYIWPQMAEIAMAVTRPPYRVLVKSGHSVGKTFLAAWLTNWFFDSFPKSIAITTAPTKRDVVDLLWSEIRLQRERSKLATHFTGPAAPEMRESWDHYAKGYTANKGESFQGRHRSRMMFVMDEACGVDAMYWTTTKTMWKPELGHIWLAILNPTNTTTQAYLEDQGGGWATFSLSCLDHPNIVAELAGQPAPIKAAVSLAQIEGWVKDWTTPITVEEKESTDVEWPPGSGNWHRPGPDFEARCMGRWPSQGTYGVWSDALWQAATTLNGKPRIHEVPLMESPQIGCDVARFGDDQTAIHVRWGDTSLFAESGNGWKITHTAGRLQQLADHYAEMVNQRRAPSKRQMLRPQEIPIKVDDDGVGGGVSDILSERGYNVVMVRSGQAAMFSTKYPNKRSELWFATAERARIGHLALGQLDRETLFKLKSQAMAPEWQLDSAGRRVVEAKDDTKEKIGRSPDDMDALNLAYYEYAIWDDCALIPPTERAEERKDAAGNWMEERQERPRESKRRLFGL